MKVGLIGCGKVAFSAHLPVYKKFNIEVVAVCDSTEERAKKAAEEFNIPFYCTNADDLAKRQEVELIDIATTPDKRLDLLRSLYRFNKPLLIQKPLSYDLDEATLICDELDQFGIKAAVNHNARWAPVSVAIMDLLKQQKLGTLYQIHHINRFNEDKKTWYTDIEDYLFLSHGLHYFDLARLYSGKLPTQVSALHLKRPGQIAKCPLVYSVNLKFDHSMIVSLYFNNSVPAPLSFDCQWFIDGTLGSIKATLDSLSVQSFDGTNIPLTKLEGNWVPDGFLGSYTNFVDSIKNNVSPPHSVRDHLQTLKLATAAAQSAKNGGMWIDVK